jgi:dUTP pyrophosphatase
MALRYKRLYMDSPEFEAPKDGDAGYDLRTYQDISLMPNTPTVVDTGIAIEIPSGYVGLILPRSGMRFKFLVDCFGVGVIDSSYRGELKLLIELHDRPDLHYVDTQWYAGDKVAQLVIVPCFTEEVEEVDTLSDTSRGAKGFGSTGR